MKYNIWQVISIALLIVIAVILINYIAQTPESEIKQSQPEVNVEIYNWGYNIYEESELLFDYWIYNYGDKEAKNIKVTCKLFNEDDYLSFSVTESHGNVASNSVSFGEMTPKKGNLNVNEEYSPLCYVSSCDDCRLLWMEIPEIKESYLR